MNKKVYSLQLIIYCNILIINILYNKVSVNHGLQIVNFCKLVYSKSVNQVYSKIEFILLYINNLINISVNFSKRFTVVYSK
jgi:hypothetical protein